MTVSAVTAFECTITLPDTSVIRNSHIGLTPFFNSATRLSLLNVPVLVPVFSPSSYCLQRDLIKSPSWNRTELSPAYLITTFHLSLPLPAYLSEQRPCPTACSTDTQWSSHLHFCTSAVPSTSKPLYPIHTPCWMPTKYLRTKSSVIFSISFLDFQLLPFLTDFFARPTLLPVS